MEDGIASFPLLHLQNNALKCVLQNMNLLNQMAFSILSKRSKSLVKSMDLKIDEISVTVGRIVSMDIHTSHRRQINLFFYMKQFVDDLNARNQVTEMYTPDFLRVYNVEGMGYIGYEWKKPGFEIKDWINHFLSIFNRSKVDTLHFDSGNLFNLKSLQNSINDVNSIDIGDSSYPAAYIQQIDQTFTSAKQFSFLLDNMENLTVCHSILCQNYDILSLLSNDHNDSARCELDDLLIMNSRSIELNTDLTEKDFNRFLKHWNNGSNPRMEYMALRFSETEDDDGNEVLVNEEVILNGLNHQTIPLENERSFERLVKGYDVSRPVIVRGGFDIQRDDGKTATIVIHKEERIYGLFDIEVFVWH